MSLQEIMRQAQKVKAKMEKVQAEVGARTFDGTAGGGMVVVTANGKNQIVKVKIEKDVVNTDEVEMLQDLIVAATNQAIQRATETMQEELSKVTGGMMGGMPGLF
jgi:DNA-binding YbaB/EbfC family protein